MTSATQQPARVLVLGANGQLARNTTRVLLQQSNAQLTLYLRRASRLENPDPSRVRVVEGDVLDTAALRSAMQGQDLVYANLAGDMARQARSIIDAMHETGVKRLIFISSMGIYGEIPGWFTHDAAVDYQLTQKGEPFKGHEVSLNSLSDLIVKLALTPGMESRHSLGVSRV